MVLHRSETQPPCCGVGVVGQETVWLLTVWVFADPFFRHATTCTTYTQPLFPVSSTCRLTRYCWSHCLRQRGESHVHKGCFHQSQPYQEPFEDRLQAAASAGLVVIGCSNTPPHVVCLKVATSSTKHGQPEQRTWKLSRSVRGTLGLLLTILFLTSYTY